MFRFLPIVTIVVSATLYQFSQKKLSSVGNPFLVLVIAYLCALGLSIGGAFLYSPWRMAQMQTIPKWVYALGLSVVGIEIGFLLAYRMNWPISTVSIYLSACSLFLLTLAGVFFFGEAMTAKKIIGLACALLAIVLLS